MQSLQRTFSRRKLDFKEAQLDNVATKKRLRKSVSAGLKETVKASSAESIATNEGHLRKTRRGSKQETLVVSSYEIAHQVRSRKAGVSKSQHHAQNDRPNEAPLSSLVLNDNHSYTYPLGEDDAAADNVVPYSPCSMVVTPLAQLMTTSSEVTPLDLSSPIQTVDTAIVYRGPFPSFTRPSPEECSEVCQRLWHLHGLEDYAKHRVARIALPSQALALLEYDVEQNAKKAISSTNRSTLDVQPPGHPRERRTVLDSLVGTILSQNTTDTNSRRAFASLKARFPTWEEVYEGDPKAVEDAIRCGGLAEIKASRILNILQVLKEERGKLCLEYIHNMSADEVKLELSRFKGVGPKTIACVLMFHLQQNEFPVDTHVYRITKMLGWVPAKADREKAYLHLNHRVPDHLKFDLHCLLVTHGKRCPRCAKGGRTQRPADGPCPLVNLNAKFLEAAPSGQPDTLPEKAFSCQGS